MLRTYHASLVVGATQALRRAKLTELTSDVRFQRVEFDCTEKKAIADVRALQAGLKLTPAGDNRAVVMIIEAQLLSPESQTTLLKVVEESPVGYALYLTADRAENVLPTLLSRCRIINLGHTKPDLHKISAFLDQSLAYQFEHGDEIEIDDALSYLATNLDKKPAIDLIESILTLKKKLQSVPHNKKLFKERILVEIAYVNRT